MNLSFLPRKAHKHFSELAHRDFVASPNIDRSRLGGFLGHSHQSTRKIGHIEKTAARRAISPDHQWILALHHPMYQRGNDMTGCWIKVIPWPISVVRTGNPYLHPMLP